MRIAVSGSHSTGKSTLIAAFLAKCPGYLHEPEAFESLADDVELTSSEGPTAEGLQALLEHTISSLALHPPGTLVVFERSPVDYLAYAAASRPSWPTGVPSRPGESAGFRRRVAAALQRALLDDDYDLFGDPESPRVIELPPSPERQLAELIRLTSD